MLKFFVLSSVLALAQCGLLPIAPLAATSIASGPALGTPLVGSVSYNAPEVTVVKQPVTITQPEIHYKTVPTYVHHQQQITYSAHAVPATVHHAVPALHHAAIPALHHAAIPSLHHSLPALHHGLPAFHHAGFPLAHHTAVIA